MDVALPLPSLPKPKNARFPEIDLEPGNRENILIKKQLTMDPRLAPEDVRPPSSTRSHGLLLRAKNM